MFRFTLWESVKKPSVDPLRKIHVTIEVSHVPTITPTAHPTRARALCELNGAFALCRSQAGRFNAHLDSTSIMRVTQAFPPALMAGGAPQAF